MREPASQGSASREKAFDLARSFAIVFMVLINFQLMLARGPSPTDDTASRMLRWVTHVPSGRASSTFVVLAGVGITLLTRNARVSGDRTEWWIAIRTLLLRSVFLLGAGLLLIQVWWIDILHFYACYLLIATLFLVWLPDLALVLVFALLVPSGLVIERLLPAPPSAPFLTPLGFAWDALVDGVHPVFPWIAFIAYGIWLGRRDLKDPAFRRGLMLAAGLTFVLTELGSLAASLLVMSVPALSPLLPFMGFWATGWTPDPLYLVSAASTATLAITLAHELVLHPRIAQHLVTRALVSTGQLALSIYVTHAVIGVVIPRNVFHWRDALSVGQVTAYWIAFVITVVVSAAIYRRFVSRGPLELVMRALTSWTTPSEKRDRERRAMTAISTPKLEPAAVEESALSGLGKLGVGLFASLALMLLAARVVGLPLPADPGSGPGERLGQLSVLRPRAEHLFELTAAGVVVLQTHSGLDLYLELDFAKENGTFARLAEDDDSGEGTDARISTSLPAGRYRVTVRPYGATTGPYVLSIHPVD